MPISKRCKLQNLLVHILVKRYVYLRCDFHYILVLGAHINKFTLNHHQLHVFLSAKYEPEVRFSKVFFARNSNLMENSLCCNSMAGHQIATNFCTAVVSCTKFCSDHYVKMEVRVKWTFHQIQIAMEKNLVKWAPALDLRHAKIDEAAGPNILQFFSWLNWKLFILAAKNF